MEMYDTITTQNFLPENKEAMTDIKNQYFEMTSANFKNK